MEKNEVVKINEIVDFLNIDLSKIGMEDAGRLRDMLSIDNYDGQKGTNIRFEIVSDEGDTIYDWEVKIIDINELS